MIPSKCSSEVNVGEGKILPLVNLVEWQTDSDIKTRQVTFHRYIVRCELLLVYERKGDILQLTT
jgi:hypothetical protein